MMNRHLYIPQRPHIVSAHADDVPSGIPLEVAVYAAAGPTDGTVDFIMAVESDDYENGYDRNGNLFLPGCMQAMGPRIMMAATNHGNAAVGVGELYRDGAEIGMRAEFLANEWGQHERMLIKSMGEGARYSFRGRASQYSFHKDVPGVVYHAVALYEGCLVMSPAGGDKTYTKKVT